MIGADRMMKEFDFMPKFIMITDFVRLLKSKFTYTELYTSRVRFINGSDDRDDLMAKVKHYEHESVQRLVKC